MNQKELHEFAIRFFCEYRTLSDEEKPKIPREDNSLDRAIKRAFDSENISKDITDKLHFSEINTGIVCVELRDLINEGVRSEILCPNLYEKSYSFLISPKAAHVLMARNNQTNDMRDFVYHVFENLYENSLRT